MFALFFAPATRRQNYSDSLELCARHKIQWQWLKGQAGHPDNEHCDKLARAEISKRRKLVGHAHPFCTNQFATDGQTIFLEMRGKSDEVTLWSQHDDYLLRGAELVVEDLCSQHESVMNALAGFRGVSCVRDNVERITGVAACSTVIRVSIHLLNLILQFWEIRFPADNANEKWIFRVVDGDFFESNPGVPAGELDCIDQAVLRVSGIQVRRWLDWVSQVFEQDPVRARQGHWRGTAVAGMIQEAESFVAENPVPLAEIHSTETTA